MILRAAESAAGMGQALWRVDSSGLNGAELVITQVTPTGFDFDVNASAGANSGELSGKAILEASEKAHYQGTAESGTQGCSLMFRRMLNRLNIDQKGDDATCGAGKGVYSSGTYVASGKSTRTLRPI